VRRTTSARTALPEGQRPCERDQRNGAHSHANEHCRRCTRGGPGGKHVVHKDDTGVSDAGRHGSPRGEDVSDVSLALGGVQDDLGRSLAAALQNLQDRPAHSAREPPSQKSGLVVSPPPLPALGRRYGHDERFGSYHLGGHPKTGHGGAHLVPQLMPTSVLERVDELRSRRLEHVCISGRGEGLRPRGTLTTARRRRAAGTRGVVTSRAPWPGRLSEPAPASPAHETVPVRGGHPGSTGGAPRGQEEPEQVARPRDGLHLVRPSISAARIASTGAGAPHQRSNEAAPC